MATRYGSSRGDTLDGDNGADTIYGGAGTDRLRGFDGDDLLYGEDGTDTLEGGAGNDLLDGGQGTDTLFGGDGRDQLRGGIGDDRLDGGSGVDTALLEGVRSDYRISTADGVTAVRDLRKGGGSGSDTLTDVERIRFADGSVFLLTPDSAPIAVADAGVVGEDGVLRASSVLANDTDADGDPLSVGAVNGSAAAVGQTIVLASGAKLTLQADGTYAYDTNGAFNDLAEGDRETDSFTYTAVDGLGGSAAQTVTVTITGANDAPTAPATRALTIDEDQASAPVAIGATDADGDTLSYSVQAGAGPKLGNVSFDQTAGTFVYTPIANTNGADSFTLLISDGNGGVREQAVSVTVNPVNDAPTAPATKVVTTDEDTATAPIAIGATDADGDTLSYSVQAGAGPKLGTVSFDQTAGTFVYTPDANANGPDSFTVSISDRNGGVREQVVSVTVNPVNDAPAAPATKAVTTDEDKATGLVAIGATDADGDALRYDLKPGTEPKLGTVAFDQAAGAFVYRPNANANGADSFTVLISDGHGGSREQAVSVSVNPVNDAPLVGGFSGASFDEDLFPYLTRTIVARDIEGDALSFSVKAGTEPKLGSVSINQQGAFTYNPDPDANGVDSFTILVSDGEGGITEHRVRFDIRPVNDAPTAPATKAVVTDEDTASAPIATQATDVDGDRLSYSVKAGEGPSIGAVSFDQAAGAFVYTPNPDANGADSFTVLISDGNGGVREQVVSVTVKPVDDVITPIDLADVAAGNGGFKILGEAGSNYAGYSVSDAGDVNGDGRADLIVGAYQNGAAYVVFGKGDGAAVNLDAVAAGTGGFKILGEATGDSAGRSVSGAGDVNGDGFADLIVGAERNSSNGSTRNGAAYVVFGKGDGTAVDLDAVAAGSGGFKIGGEATDDFAGFSVSDAGDVNGDGLADVIVGAVNNSGDGSYANGAAYVVYGKSDGMAVDLDAVAAGTGGFKILGEASEDFAGISVSGAGDVNGDGLADLIVGSDWNDSNGFTSNGAAYVVFGKRDGTVVDLDAVAAGTGGFKILGEATPDGAGISVSDAGDVNGDGRADLIVGAFRNDSDGSTNNGAAYVVFGKDDRAAVDLDAVAAGTGGFKISGEADGNAAGTSVSGAGDMNGDGMADLIVGATGNSSDGLLGNGAAYVVFGKKDGAAVDLDAVGVGGGGFKIGGEAQYDNAGISVSGAGDVNGDGLADLFIGAWQNNSDGSTDNGAAYVVFGSTDWVF